MDNKQSSPASQNFSSTDGLDLSGYVRLRTLIDSLECGAIRYFLRESEGKGGRLDELSEKLIPIIDWVWKKEFEIDCPEGYVDCQGVCVPYPCPQ